MPLTNGLGRTLKADVSLPADGSGKKNPTMLTRGVKRPPAEKMMVACKADFAQVLKGAPLGNNNAAGPHKGHGLQVHKDLPQFTERNGLMATTVEVGNHPDGDAHASNLKAAFRQAMAEKGFSEHKGQGGGKGDQVLHYKTKDGKPAGTMIHTHATSTVHMAVNK